MTSTGKPRSVVALDIDGALNVFPPYGPLQAGWERHVVELGYDDIPFSPYTLRPAPDALLSLTLTLTVNASLHCEWITRLRERADVVWATTWEENSNTFVAPFLGIEPLPVYLSVARFGWRMGQSSSAWKAEHLAKITAPLVWIDDLNFGYDDWPDRAHSDTLIITTDERIGLTPEQMDKIDQFVDDHR